MVLALYVDLRLTIQAIENAVKAAMRLISGNLKALAL
jgi:hypothetical protein